MITTAICNSYKLEILQGIHQPGDDYKIALYTNAATLGASTTAYSATNEVATGGGYTAGGQSLTGFTTALDGSVAYVDFDDSVWNPSTITARGALIYNATRSNRAVAAFDFGADITSTAAAFTVVFPAPGATTAAVRVA